MGIYLSWLFKCKHTNLRYVLTGDLREGVVEKMNITRPLPKKDTKVRIQKRSPKIGTMIGCWGAKFFQWSWTISEISSGNPSIWLAPIGYWGLSFVSKKYVTFSMAFLEISKARYGLKQFIISERPFKLSRNQKTCGNLLIIQLKTMLKGSKRNLLI